MLRAEHSCRSFVMLWSFARCFFIVHVPCRDALMYRNLSIAQNTFFAFLILSEMTLYDLLTFIKHNFYNNIFAFLTDYNYFG